MVFPKRNRTRHASHFVIYCIGNSPTDRIVTFGLFVSSVSLSLAIFFSFLANVPFGSVRFACDRKVGTCHSRLQTRSRSRPPEYPSRCSTRADDSGFEPQLRWFGPMGSRSTTRATYSRRMVMSETQHAFSTLQQHVLSTRSARSRLVAYRDLPIR